MHFRDLVGHTSGFTTSSVFHPIASKMNINEHGFTENMVLKNKKPSPG